MKYDLHVHSNVSDGKVSRKEIIENAVKNKLQYMSFTEHNDFQVLTDEELYLKNNIEFINGIEFDVICDKSFHILCYFNQFDDKIINIINQYKENTNDRSEILLSNISKLQGIDVKLEDIKKFSHKEHVTKRDVIDWLIFNKYARTVHEASYKYTGKKSISYVPKFSLNFKDIAYNLNNIGCKLVLAHPSTLNYNFSELDLFVKKIVNLGLDGIEVINTSKITSNKTELYKLLALKYNLLTSGGSDFHNFKDNNLGIENEDSKKIIKLLK